MDAPGRLPPLPALRGFEAAARLGGVSRAAAELHLTHGAISHQIRALEDYLGQDLFARDGRAIVPTAAGEELLAATNAALRLVADACARLRRRHDSHRLAVSVMPSFAGRWLAPRIASFIDANPGCELSVVSTTDHADFVRDDIDLAIRWGLGGYTGVRAECLMDDVLFPVVSPRFAGRLPTRPEDLAGLPLLRSDGEDWTPWFRAAGLDWAEPSTGLIQDDSGLVVQAAIDGLGVAIARRSLASFALRNGQLLRPFDIEVPILYREGQVMNRILPGEELARAPRWRYWLVQPEGRLAHPLLDRFIAWLKDEVRADLA